MEKEKINWKNFVNDLNENLKETNTFEFVKNIGKKTKSGDSLIKLISDYKKITHDGKIYDNKNLNLTDEDQIEIVKDFFSKLSPEFEQKINNVFDKNDTRYKLNFSSNNTTSAVGHNGNNNYLDVTVGLDGTLAGLRTLAHECAHAMSNHHLKLIELIQNKQDPSSFIDEGKKFDKDCIGEIESHIIELLFNDYLLEQNLISQELHDNFLTGKSISFNRNCSLILEEYDIVKHNSEPITSTSFALYKARNKLKGKEFYNKQLFRAKFITQRKHKSDSERRSYSSHRFRYIVGEVVSTLWYENYKSCSSSEQKEMLKSLNEFFNNTDKLDLNDCCKTLVGKSTFETFNEYYKNLQLEKIT